MWVLSFSYLWCANVLVILGPLWQTFVSSLGVYERASIEGVEDSYDGRYDSDGSEKSLESFIIQVMRVLKFFIVQWHHIITRITDKISHELI